MADLTQAQIDNYAKLRGATQAGRRHGRTPREVADYNFEVHLPAAKLGDQESKAKIVEMMDGAIRTLAISFHDRNLFLAVDDLIQEGRLRVLRAIDGWKEGRRTKFSTYAYRAVKNRMIEIATRTRPLHQIDERLPDANSDDGRGRMCLENMLCDRGRKRVLVEAFAGLGWDRSRVLLCRLGPVIYDREPRTWRDVARMENLPIKRCQRLYAEAVEMVRAAHGEQDDGEE